MQLSQDQITVRELEATLDADPALRLHMVTALSAAAAQFMVNNWAQFKQEVDETIGLENVDPLPRKRWVKENLLEPLKLATRIMNGVV